MRVLLKRRIWNATLSVFLLGTALAEPQRAPDLLKVGVPLTRPIAGELRDRLALPLAVGQFVRVVVMQAGSDVVVTLRDPQQRALMESDLPNGAFGAETVATVAEIGGDYSVEVRLGNPRSAAGTYKVTLEVARDATPADRELMSAYRSFLQANQLRKQRTLDTSRQALDLLNQVRPVLAASGDRLSEGMSLFMAGSMLADSGEILAALRYAEEMVAVFHEAGDWNGEASGRNNMGGMLDILGEPRNAQEAYRQALALARAGGNRNQEANVLNNIGKLEGDLGNWQNALDYYRQALPVLRREGNTRLEGTVTHNVGSTYLKLGDTEAALLEFEKALVLRKASGDKGGEGITLQLMAIAYSVDQPDKAVEYLKQALELEVTVGNRRQEAEIRMELGRTYIRVGRLREAEESISKAVDGERAAEDRRNAARALVYLSSVLTLEGRFADALQPAEQALADFRTIGDITSEARALEAIARAESENADGPAGNLSAATGHMEQALRLIEDSRTRADSEQFRTSFFASRQDSYSFYIDLLMRSGNARAALEVNERSRARSMLDLLAEAGTDFREGVDVKLLAREREISDLLNAKGTRLLNAPRPELQREIQELENEYHDVQAAIRKNSPRYAALTQPAPLTATEIQTQLLDDDAILFEYALGEKRSYLWTVGRNEFHSWELPSRAKIEQQVERVSELLTARAAVKRLETSAAKQKRIAEADAALPSASRELSDMILAPAAQVLGKRTLVVVPDGALQRLPFAMLPLSVGRVVEPLIVSREVVTLPSASALAALRSQIAGRKPASKMMAVFADPVFDGSDPRAGGTVTSAPASLAASRILEHLADAGGSATATLKIPRLPYTAQEAEQILSVARGNTNLKAIGLDASRAAATNGQLSDYRYIHFATHGYLDTERPSLSALVLSQIDANRQPQDGFLRVNDIYNARLSADLAVLSACQTGLGKEVRGEGLMGLTRAFLYAGVPRVIVSLWNVNDRATADLMATLYRKLLRDGKPPAAALREAQLEMRKQKQWESPYYWAAFVQHGDWR